MLSNTELLELYKAEKNVLDDPFEQFMSFKDWKEEYVREYKDTHVTVSVDEADRMMDAIVEECEKDQNQSVIKLVTEEKVQMSETAEKKTRKSRAKTKMEKARTVFNKYFGQLTRKEIVEKMTMKSVGLTEKGAKTYYQKLKKEAESVEG